MQSRRLRSSGDAVELGDDGGQRIAAGGPQSCRRTGLDDRLGRRHLVELVEEAVDGRRLRSGISHVGAHQFVGLLHGLVAETLPQLPDRCWRIN